MTSSFALTSEFTTADTPGVSKRFILIFSFVPQECAMKGVVCTRVYERA